MRTINYLINVYSITFRGLYYWLVHSFLVFWVRYWQCTRLFIVRTSNDGSHAIWP